jgi:hypothetical protein
MKMTGRPLPDTFTANAVGTYAGVGVAWVVVVYGDELMERTHVGYPFRCAVCGKLFHSSTVTGSISEPLRGEGHQA